MMHDTHAYGIASVRTLHCRDVCSKASVLVALGRSTVRLCLDVLLKQRAAVASADCNAADMPCAMETRLMYGGGVVRHMLCSSPQRMQQV